LYQFLFAPGMSSALRISEISGRGVGLDVVRTKVLKLKGAVSVDSTPGRGAVFTIRLPMTLAIVRSLLVSVHGQTFAAPMQAVSQILRVEKSAIAKVAGGDVMFHGGRVYSLYRLGDALHLPKLRASDAAQEPVLIVYTGTREVAVQVDKILSGREIVVKTLGAHLRRVHGLMGATFLGDGAIVPILNLAELFAGARGERAEAPVHPPAPRPAAHDCRVMIVDDSVSVRRVTSNIVKSQNWTPLQAKDGVDALEQLRSTARTPDVILLDVEMPRMNGYELLAALKEQENFRRIPVVMITSRAGDKHRSRALELGASEYLVKPFQPDGLLSLIRRLTARVG
jgi:chemosensory pili system protein ChpA (sensor histidine kinase/response regulator)